MPFLVLPRSETLSDAQLARLGRRMCPYVEQPERVLRTVGHDVWATSLGRAGAGSVENRLSAGTADFSVRVSGDDLLVRTDPLGTCPVWYVRLADGWAVSPEAKALAVVASVTLRPEDDLLAGGPRDAAWTPYTQLSRLPPGCSLRLSGEQAVVEGECPTFRLGSGEGDDDDCAARLGQALVDSADAAGANIDALQLSTGAFVSGGIDSSIACALARRRGPLATFTLGTEYGNEFEGARRLAEALDCRHHERQLERAAVSAEFLRVVEQNEVFDGLTAEILLQLSALYSGAQNSCTHIVTGYGSDLLFDGMLRHEAYMDAVGLQTTVELIERTRWTGELSPFLHWSLGLSVEHVFWNPQVIEAALAVPRSLCRVDGVEKHVLREASVSAGLLDRRLAFLPKIGMTDGTRANRLLSEELDVEGPYGYLHKSRVALARLAAVVTGLD